MSCARQSVRCAGDIGSNEDFSLIILTTSRAILTPLLSFLPKLLELMIAAVACNLAAQRLRFVLHPTFIRNICTALVTAAYVVPHYCPISLGTAHSILLLLSQVLLNNLNDSIGGVTTIYTWGPNLYKVSNFCPFPLSNHRVLPYLHTTLHSFVETS